MKHPSLMKHQYMAALSIIYRLDENRESRPKCVCRGVDRREGREWKKKTYFYLMRAVRLERY